MQRLALYPHCYTEPINTQIDLPGGTLRLTTLGDNYPQPRTSVHDILALFRRRYDSATEGGLEGFKASPIGICCAHRS